MNAVMLHFSSVNSENDSLIKLSPLKQEYHNADEFKSSPVVFNKRVYIGAHSNVLAFDANTEVVKWRFLTTSLEDPYSSLTIVDKPGNIYYSTVSGSKN